MTRNMTVMKYVLPTILSQCAFFLFTIIDGIFVGHGVGTDALGAVNLAMPFIMIISAAFMLTTIGGVMIFNLGLTSLSIIRWSERHYNINSSSALQTYLDRETPDWWMSKRFMEWKFLDETTS